MRKLYLLLTVCVLGLLAVACSDDESFPSVDVNVTMSPVTQYDGKIYTVADSTFNVESITVKSLSGNNSALSTVGYYWDGLFSAASNVSPFSAKFLISNFQPGRHILQMRTTVLEVDKTITPTLLNYDIYVVPTVADLPKGALPLGRLTDTATLNPTK